MDTQWFTVLQLAHTSSISSKIAEINYKLLTRWHYTLTVLHKVFPDISDLCWRGCGEKVTHTHVWWQRPLIRPFWSSILHWIKVIQGSEVPNDQWVVLFNCRGESVGRYKNSITLHLLNAAKGLIPRFWKQTTIPTMRLWLQTVDHIYHMEDLTYSLRDKVEVSNKI